MRIPKGYILILKVDYDKLLNRLSMMDARIKELEVMLNKDSQNSHKPPSSDGYKKQIQNNREKSSRSVGGQKGHEGKTLQMVEKPDKVIEHKVECCDHCGTNLQGVLAKKYYRRQVHDLPPIKIEVTEHHVEVKECKLCGKDTIASCDVSASVQYGNRIKSMGVYLNQYQMLPFERTRETMEDLFGSSISAEVLQQSNALCYDNLEQKVELEIKQAIIVSDVVHSDETGIRCEKSLKWIHVNSTSDHTYYAIDDKRGKDAMDRIGILPVFKGNSVHDRLASYDTYNNCQHSYCNAHLLRELKAEEENKKPWAATMIVVLLDAKILSEQETTTNNAIAEIEKRYDSIIKKAIKEEPLPIHTPHKRGRKKKTKSLLLLECFRDKKKGVLRFLHDKTVPFDNNLAERDLRMVKLKQKISGCFRTFKGGQVFCRIRSYISTIRKQNGQVWEALQTIMKKSTVDQIIARGCE